MSGLIFYSNMTSFIYYKSNVVIKSQIYFIPPMRTTGKIWTSFPSKFIYLYRTVVYTNIKMLALCLCIFFSRRNNTKDMYQSTLTFVNCCLPVTLFPRKANDVADFCDLSLHSFTCFRCWNQNAIKLENIKNFIAALGIFLYKNKNYCKHEV